MLKKKLMDVLEIFLKSKGEENHEEAVAMRMGRCYFFLGIVLLFFMVAMFYRSGVINGLNAGVDNMKEMEAKKRDSEYVVAGDVYDRNETLLVEHEEVGKSGKYVDGSLYSPLLGYIRERKAVNEEGTVSYTVDGERLLKYYSTEKEELFQNVGIDGDKGRDLILTLDHELQQEVDRLLTQEMGREARGSAIVMNAKTGEILAFVSHPSYDFNDLSNSLVARNQTAKEDEAAYPITYKGHVVPGSIFKLITAVALIDNGLEDMQVLDNDTVIGSVEVVNSYGSTGRTINYVIAIEDSSNVFFASASTALGKEKMDEIASKFKIGEYLELDFGSVASKWTLEEKNADQLAAVGYGQGDTLFSTMHAAMMTQTIANDGVMLTPYMIHEIRDAAGQTVKTGETTILNEVTSKETADKVTEAMLAATKSHLHVVEGSENRAVYEKYKIASKTGTGENGDNADTNNAWFVSFAPADNPQYVVVANQCKTSKYGQNLMDTVAGIYKYLFE